jgi:hypothetical protein
MSSVIRQIEELHRIADAVALQTLTAEYGIFKGDGQGRIPNALRMTHARIPNVLKPIKWSQ